MKNSNSLVIGLSILFGLALLITFCTPKKITNGNSVVPRGNTAANFPDKFAWELFAYAFQSTDESNVEWQNWASQEYTYKNPCGPPPPWPEGRQKLEPSTPKLQSIIEKLNESSKALEVAGLTPLTLNFTSPYIEEVRFNRPAFNYIVGNGLYNLDKVYTMAKDVGIEFPRASIIMKIQWKKLTADEMDEYYWREVKHRTNAGKFLTDTLGLVGFHIVSKELPNWVWSTFEHVSADGRCDYIGCKDEFGLIPSYIKPHENVVGKKYIPGERTPALEALFKKFNIDPIFKNYRLKGTQTEYTDNKGQTTQLGNAILEAGLVETASCITCHAYAAVNGGFNEIATTVPGELNFETGIKPNSTLGFHPVCYNGIPETDFFYPEDSLGNVPPDSIYYQLDFMWQLVKNAAHCENENVN